MATKPNIAIKSESPLKVWDGAKHQVTVEVTPNEDGECSASLRINETDLFFLEDEEQCQRIEIRFVPTGMPFEPQDLIFEFELVGTRPPTEPPDLYTFFAMANNSADLDSDEAGPLNVDYYGTTPPDSTTDSNPIT